MHIRKCALLLVSLFACGFLGAVEIPLEKSVLGTSDKGQRFGVVDIEEVLDTFPETKKKEAELKKYIEGVNSDIKERENQIEKLRVEVEAAEKAGVQTPPQAPLPTEGFVVLGSTAPAKQADDAANQNRLTAKELEAKKKELETKIKELGEFKETSLEKIGDTKKSFSQSVMGKIYGVLEEIAKEEAIQIIVDKNNVLYGKAEIDLTRKTIDRLSGKR